ncbi:MAG: CDP-diacylglycerol--glycerol-3-phosphate 3-phosphatidyltransferase [Clostridia bacterium]|nr:CDP-diacylglycerol--glycerol-3-phosphate 3-phosphatidyltransferase [Clostridia bacterium]
MKMNLPNKLTVVRMIMVPIFVIVLMVSDAIWASVLGIVLFVAAAFTDMLDGKIARKNNLVTDFGKFLDPLADKFMVIGAMLVILFRSMTAETPNVLFCNIFFWAVVIVIFRELAVTSIRLVASGSKGIVIAANMLGKIKTCVQIACVVCCLAEPVIYGNVDALGFLMEYLPLSLVTSALMIVFTLWSGINYIVSYWKYLDPEK